MGWLKLEDKRASRIVYRFDKGGLARPAQHHAAALNKTDIGCVDRRLVNSVLTHDAAHLVTYDGTDYSYKLEGSEEQS